MFQWKPTAARAATACAVAAIALTGCERGHQAPTAPPPVAQAPPAAVPSPPLPPPPLGRSELLTALEAARAAFAAGQPDPEQNLAGRRFSIREPFGCAGAPAAKAEDGVARAVWEPKVERIDIRLTPGDWSRELIVGEDAARWEAAEGYWITHPWLLSAGCPAARQGDPPQTPAETPLPRTDGLAAVFERDSSRVGRRAGKPFSLTLRDAAEPPPPAGYRLVLEGRFVAFASGRAVRCLPRGPDARPACLVAAIVDRLAIESADGKLLKEWRLG